MNSPEFLKILKEADGDATFVFYGKDNRYFHMMNFNEGVADNYQVEVPQGTKGIDYPDILKLARIMPNTSKQFVISAKASDEDWGKIHKLTNPHCYSSEFKPG